MEFECGKSLIVQPKTLNSFIPVISEASLRCIRHLTSKHC